MQGDQAAREGTRSDGMLEEGKEYETERQDSGGGRSLSSRGMQA